VKRLKLPITETLCMSSWFHCKSWDVMWVWRCTLCTVILITFQKIWEQWAKS